MDAEARLDAAKRGSTLQLLFRTARRVDEAARGRIRVQVGRVVARRSTAELLPHLDLEGTRMGDLAARLGVSKQAASQRVAELVAEGLVAVGPDPADRRARRVVFTPLGIEAILHGLGVLATLEQELGDQIGVEPLVRLGETLRALDRALTRLEEP